MVYARSLTVASADKYDDGPDALTQQRLQRLVDFGLVPKDIVPVGVLVELIDENIGRVIDHLEATGELDNNVILFMSDNGAEGAALEAIPLSFAASSTPRRSDVNFCPTYYDSSLDNIGDKTSFAWVWSTMDMCRDGTIPWFKVLDHGGRHSLPMPNPLSTISSQARRYHASFHHRYGYPSHDLGDGSGPRACPGWIDHLTSSDYAAPDSTVHGEDVHVHGWELFGLRAIREGKWKAVWLNKPRGKDDWEIYDLEKDPTKMNDVSDKEPQVMRRLVDHWERYYAETGMTQTPEFAITKA
ncbi:arylsulfatase [Colletotrichum salicis]|uniref:Arylsulfatase n=1 Tax=Colletotrichum salicis TaxID=1209931 RepID=A0A135U514_9PEZI|nr:arylsulfatase [Colletotrichum salicis]